MEPLTPSAATTPWPCGASTPRPHQPAPPEEDPPVEQFGDHAALADELLDLVLAGTEAGHRRARRRLRRTRASRSPGSAATGSPATAPVIPRAILRTTELRLGPLASVDDAFAWDEGEDDRTRASWLAGHLAYSARTPGCPAAAPRKNDLEVVFETVRGRRGRPTSPTLADPRSSRSNGLPSRPIWPELRHEARQQGEGDAQADLREPHPKTRGTAAERRVPAPGNRSTTGRRP